MKEVVRAACPGCHRPLNVPADWLGKTVRCKHCGHGMQLRPAAVSAVAAAVPLATPVDGPVPAWEPLPEYTPPASLPTPVPAAPQAKYVSAFDAGDKYRGRGDYRGPRKHGWVKFAVLGTILVLIGGLGLFGASKAGLFRKGEPTPGEGEPGGPIAHNPGSTTPATIGTFPRRMLAISIHSYLYVNPLHNGDSGFAQDDTKRTGTDAAVHRLAERWKVPKDQLYHLTDAPLLSEKRADPKPAAKADSNESGQVPKGRAKGSEPALAPEPAKRLAKSMPLRSVIEGTVAQFVDTSREQDRVVILFCGHAMERKGKTYLVPIEGDLDEVDSLIPLDWFYEKLGACKAQEKVVIFDVCRFHPERGIERPNPGPMTEALESALHSPPDGVTVITSCSRDEQSVETDYYNTQLSFDTPGVKGTGVDLRGSFFLSMFHAASIAGALSPDKKLPVPADELPVDRLTKWMREKLGEVVHFKFPDRRQTLKATIKKRSEPVAYDPAEPAPGRFDFPIPPPSADPRAVMAIIREVQLPPVKAFREDAPPPSVSDVLPFSAETLKDYLAGELKLGDKPTPFQQGILDAVTGMRAVRSPDGGDRLPEEFGGESTDRAKDELRKYQLVPATVEDDLKDHLQALEKMADQRDKQPRRWQVHYDYVVAQLKLRICYANQYNLALANVRGGKVPDLQPGQNGYRLSAELNLDKNTGAEYKEMFNEARKSLTDIARDNPSTPWALLAKSDRTVAIGLRLTGGTVGTR